MKYKFYCRLCQSFLAYAVQEGPDEPDTCPVCGYRVHALPDIAPAADAPREPDNPLNTESHK